jgi:dihydroorotase
MDLSRANVAAARDAIGSHRDFIVGVKARLSRDVAGPNDFEVLRRAQEVASSFKMPVMIHMGQTMTPLPKLLALLKSGDIVTHMFAPPPNSIIDDDGHILPEVTAARKRGVWFDLGNGRTGHLRWDIAERVLKAGFLPDTLSTDWTLEGRAAQVIDFPNVMSKFLLLGLPLDRVVAFATVNASRIFDLFHGRGTLNVGAPADIAILELREGNFEFVDNFENKRYGNRRLFPGVTVLAGKKVATRG